MSKWIKILIIVAIVSLVSVSVVYAYDVLWSGKVKITIEPPSAEGGADIQVTGIHVDKGSWDEATGRWMVSLKRGQMACMIVNLANTGSDIGQVSVSVNGQSSYSPVLGVEIDAINNSAGGIPEGAEDWWVSFAIDVSADAEPGTLPDINLEIRQE